MMIKALADLPLPEANLKQPDAAASKDFAATLKAKILPVAAHLRGKGKTSADQETPADAGVNTQLPQATLATLIAPAMPPVPQDTDSPPQPQTASENHQQSVTPALMPQPLATAAGATAHGDALTAGLTSHPLQILRGDAADTTPEAVTRRDAFFLPTNPTHPQEKLPAAGRSQPERLTDITAARPEKQIEAHAVPPAHAEVPEHADKGLQPALVRETLAGPALPPAPSHSPIGVLPANAATGVLELPAGTPAWQHALGQQLMLFTRNGIHNAELRLQPEELGSLQIHLRLHSDQAQIHFVTASQQVKAALEAALPHLRSLLDESGIHLGQSSVGADSAAWDAFSSSPQGFDSSSGQGSAFSSSTEQGGEAVEITEPVNEAQPQRMTRFSGVNTFV